MSAGGVNPLLRVLGTALRRELQKGRVVSAAGVFCNTLLHKSYVAAGGTGVEQVTGVCACPHDAFFASWSGPQVFLVENSAESGPQQRVTDLDANKWGIMMSMLDGTGVWNDPEQAFELLQVASVDFKEYLAYKDMDMEGMPWKVPLLDNVPLAYNIDGLQQFRWHYAYGPEAAELMASSEIPPAHREHLQKFQEKVDLFVANEAAFLAVMGSEMENRYYQLLSVLEDTAAQYKRGELDVPDLQLTEAFAFVPSEEMPEEAGAETDAANHDASDKAGAPAGPTATSA